MKETWEVRFIMANRQITFSAQIDVVLGVDIKASTETAEFSYMVQDLAADKIKRETGIDVWELSGFFTGVEVNCIKEGA